MKKLSRFLTTTEGKFLTFIAAAVLLSFAYYFYAMNNKANQPAAEVTVSEQDHVRGAVAAKVTLVEFGDFQCPACGAYEPLIRQVEADNANVLRVVFKHFPLTQIHPNALLAAKASEAAGLQGKFWEMHDILYDKQTEWSGTLSARDAFIAYAGTLGLDVAKFTQDLNNQSIEDKVVAEYKEGIRLGVQGTPTFFLNGKMIQNPSSPEEFNKLIQDAAEASN
jgi:protein-disulfide isomerase